MNREKIYGCDLSDVGKVRKNNEDNYLLGHVMNAESKGESSAEAVVDTKKCNCFAVFDGMGGIENGEVASRIAAQTFQKMSFILEENEASYSNYYTIKMLVKNTFSEASNSIKERQLQGSLCGTTASVVMTWNDKVKIFHVGDTRVYIYRNGELYLLSVDQTLAQMKVDMGVYKSINEASEKEYHQLTNFLGADYSIVVPFESDWISLEAGDRILICSDGLYDMCNDKQILYVLEKEKNIKSAASSLVDFANRNGGKDNVTVLLMEKLCQ